MVVFYTHRACVMYCLMMVLLAVGEVGCTHQSTLNHIVPVQSPVSLTQDQPNHVPMQLTSSAFEAQGMIPALYTCDGKNISPPLRIAHVLSEAKSLVLIVEDPDAPTKTWVHWVMYNISPSTTVIEEGKFPPDATQGINDFAKTAYGGPCPPSGTHRYFFKLYALKRGPNLTANLSKQELEKEMQGDIVEQTELIGLYSKR